MQDHEQSRLYGSNVSFESIGLRPAVALVIESRISQTLPKAMAMVHEKVIYEYVHIYACILTYGHILEIPAYEPLTVWRLMYHMLLTALLYTKY